MAIQEIGIWEMGFWEIGFWDCRFNILGCNRLVADVTMGTEDPIPLLMLLWQRRTRPRTTMHASSIGRPTGP